MAAQRFPSVAVGRTATSLVEVWEKYIAAHPEAKEFQTKTLLFFDELESIFEGTVATGQWAKASGAPPSDDGYDFDGEEMDEDEDDGDGDGDGDGDNDEEDDGRADAPARGQVAAGALAALAAPGAGKSGTPGRTGSGKKAKKQPVPKAGKRKRSQDEVIEVLGKIVSNQEKKSDLTSALELFTSKWYSKDLEAKDRLKIKAAFAANTAHAVMFLQLAEDERVEFIAESLKKD
jgi:hypothetical protein